MAINFKVDVLGDFAHQGFTLKYPDDHIIELHHQGEVIARFSQTGATRESLQEECSNHLVGHKKKEIKVGARPGK